MSDNFKLEMLLPQIPDIELLAVEGLRKMANHIGIVDDKIGEASLLVTEAIINAFEHGSDDQSQVKVQFTLTNEKIIIFVEDYGEGFDPSKIEAPDIKDKIHNDHKRGWGLKLMESMSDDFLVESDSQGTKITMIKNLG